MTYFDAIILGVVEGITEFLPISSTGHLILAGELLGLPSTEFLKSFDIAIQLGAILAVVALYWRSLFDIEMIKKLAVAFIPTGIIGFALYYVVKTILLDNLYVVLISLALGGIALIVFELSHKEAPASEEQEYDISYKQAAGIGTFQALGMIPGISRSGATIVGGLLLGLPRKTIVEFSFLLAVPTMAAATGYDLMKNADLLSFENIGVLAVGFVVSFVVALAAIRWLLSYVRTHTFIPFGVYRILAALVFWLVILI